MEAAASRLSDAHIAAVFSQGPRLGVGDGSAWISFTSPSGTARLTRAPDGSARSHAQRHRDGFVLVHESHSTVSEDDLSALVAALAPAAKGA
jgi:hypothetical protein